MLYGGTPCSQCKWLVYFQICRRRSKVTNAKSPGPPASTGKSSHRPYKHLILLPFSAIKRVVDICETPGASRWFLTGLVCMCSCTIVPYASFLWFCCLCKSNESLFCNLILFKISILHISLLWCCWLGDRKDIQCVSNLCHLSPKVPLWKKQRK